MTTDAPISQGDRPSGPVVEQEEPEGSGAPRVSGTRALPTEVECLKRENAMLAERLQSVRTETSERQSQIEGELHDLANLYVATVHLLSGRSVDDVLRHLVELLQQLVGVEAFALYLRGSDNAPVRVASHGLASAEDVLSGADGELLTALFEGGPARISEEQLGDPASRARPAALTLRLGAGCGGALVIHRLLPQKTRWAPVDYELFELVAAHALGALATAALRATAEGADDPLRLLIEYFTARGEE